MSFHSDPHWGTAEQPWDLPVTPGLVLGVSLHWRSRRVQRRASWFRWFGGSRLLVLTADSGSDSGVTPGGLRGPGEGQPHVGSRFCYSALQRTLCTSARHCSEALGNAASPGCASPRESTVPHRPRSSAAVCREPGGPGHRFLFHPLSATLTVLGSVETQPGSWRLVRRARSLARGECRELSSPRCFAAKETLQHCRRWPAGDADGLAASEGCYQTGGWCSDELSEREPGFGGPLFPECSCSCRHPLEASHPTRGKWETGTLRSSSRRNPDSIRVG